MQSYNFIIVIRKGDLDITNIVSKYFNKRVKVTLIDDSVVRVSILEVTLDPYKRLQEILDLLDMLKLTPLTYGIQKDGQTITRNK